MPGEKVIYRTRLHPIVLFGPAILLFVVIGVAREAFNVGIPEALVVALVAILTSFPRSLSYFTSEFGITTKRVLVKVGFIHRRSLEILLTKVEGVMLDQSILGRIFGYGTVVVNGTGGSKEPLDMIDDPLEFRKRLQEQIAVIQGPTEVAGL